MRYEHAHCLGIRSAGIARAGVVVALAVVCLGTSARARDIVHLDDGRFLEGEVTRETNDALWLTSGNSTIRIQQSRIMRIERNKPLPPWQVRRRKKLKEELAKRAEANKAAAEKARLAKKAADTKKDAEKAARLIEDLGSDDADTRRQAAALLEREGPKAIPALTDGLRHANTFARESSARLLGRANARESVRAMIIALNSAVPEKRKIRPWQRSFVRALRTSISAMTGQDFKVSVFQTYQGKAAEEYVTWWDGEDPTVEKKGGGRPIRGACISWDTPQIGEESIDAKDPELEKKLWDARRIGDERNSYTPPESSGSPLGDAPGRG
jgi:hypothetical protein